MFDAFLTYCYPGPYLCASCPILDGESLAGWLPQPWHSVAPGPRPSRRPTPAPEQALPSGSPGLDGQRWFGARLHAGGGHCFWGFAANSWGWGCVRWMADGQLTSIACPCHVSAPRVLALEDTGGEVRGPASCCARRRRLCRGESGEHSCRVRPPVSPLLWLHRLRPVEHTATARPGLSTPRVPTALFL